MRILVTGGAGYIGSVIADQLLQDGHAVVVLDNLSKGHRDAIPDQALFVEGDLLNDAVLGQAFRQHQIDAVIHMAALSLVGESMVHPERYYMNNVVTSLRLFDAMLAAGVRTLVFSSTAATYGEPARQPIHEDDPPAPSNPYGETKLTVERAMAWYAGAHGLRFASLRYFNAAGATELRGERHQPETHLIPLVLRAARDPRHPVTIFGSDYPTRDGTCVRDYIHVSDLAAAHVLALEALSAERIQTEIFNLGCGDGYTVKEVIDISRAITGRDIPVVAGARRPGDPAVLIASSQKIHRVLGWSPKKSSLRQIVGSAWDWEERVSQARAQAR